MLNGIDHIVIAAQDLEQASVRYRELGFTVVPGGRHPIGTHNALIAFADGSYIELIAFYEPNPDHRWWAPLARGGGLVDFCLRTDDLRADTLAFRRAGVDIGDPQPLTRKRPDGYELRWLLSIPRGDHRAVAPFLIEDETPRDERVPRETRHANGVTGIVGLTVAIDDVPTVRGWYAAVVGNAGREVARPELDASGVRFTIGPHAFDFVAPRSASSALHAWIDARGASPYAATLRTSSGPGGPLDPAKTLGARLALA